ncbi:MAG TPA: helix-turn-helix domain-containing protein [Mycobacterium sp.]|nr:helix-turn-helix domain-containing protein [Mycobacterium sp.]
MRSAEEFETVQRLVAAGLNDCAIARQTGIPRPTVWGWRRRPPVRQPRNSRTSPCTHDFSGLPANAYSYLLGLYLGDGCISRHPRAWRLRIVLDIKYPGIIDRCRDTIDTLMPGQRAAVLRCVKNCVEVSLYSKHWPCLFPQHGPGKNTPVRSGSSRGRKCS